MTKREIKNQLDSLIIELELHLQNETEDANCFIDVNDWWDLLNHCPKSQKTYQDLSTYENAYGHQPRDLTRLIRYYENQIKQFKKDCEDAKDCE